MKNHLLCDGFGEEMNCFDRLSMTIKTVGFAHVSGIADCVGTLDVHIDYAQTDNVHLLFLQYFF
ncbi:hypothetical protein GCM10008119_31460 [Pedobacter mendelii]|uniref:Uncharacterized protein n=1 Tax=Pedobacter mendelii TaxID=1908240 RepID=A0ABQ2BK75_9SPHI|nr:hypothetical protein GCM10008119_31460 [Pedobacter mendelii]